MLKTNRHHATSKQIHRTSNKRAIISAVKPRCLHISAWDNKPLWSVSKVRYCWKIWEKLGPKWPEREVKISRLNRERGRYGVRLDLN
jgi:hypothetical protein